MMASVCVCLPMAIGEEELGFKGGEDHHDGLA